MTPLQSRALATLPLPAAEVERIFDQLRGQGFVAELCASHERLRAELEGVTAMLEEMERKVAHGCTDANCEECSKPKAGS